MRKIILASHARFAEGIKSTLEMIMGLQENLSAFCAYTEEEIDFKAKIKEIIAAKAQEDEIIICTDMFGGSVNNELMELMKIEGVYLVSGINILFLLQLFISDVEAPTADTIRDCIEAAKQGIVYCNDFDLG